ncbi:MAG: hypothetical protein LBJ84_05805 [Oscillospiraceae bacterium]|nr:hypothetical protein [Oscillospiraceae bacterium]
MARYVPNTYRNHRAARVALTIAASLVLAALIAAVALFFGLRKYAVYPEDGNGKVRLEIPWLKEDGDGQAADDG